MQRPKDAMTKSAPTSAQLVCRIARTVVDRHAVFQLRYRVYVEEMDKPLASANHLEKTVRDELDEHAVIFFVEAAGKVVATVRSLWGGQHIPHYYRNWFALGRFPELPDNVIAFSSRLMIE